MSYSRAKAAFEVRTCTPRARAEHAARAQHSTSNATSRTRRRGKLRICRSGGAAARVAPRATHAWRRAHADRTTREGRRQRFRSLHRPGEPRPSSRDAPRDALLPSKSSVVLTAAVPPARGERAWRVVLGTPRSASRAMETVARVKENIQAVVEATRNANAERELALQKARPTAPPRLRRCPRAAAQPARCQVVRARALACFARATQRRRELRVRAAHAGRGARAQGARRSGGGAS